MNNLNRRSRFMELESELWDSMLGRLSMLKSSIEVHKKAAYLTKTSVISTNKTATNNMKIFEVTWWKMYSSLEISLWISFRITIR